MAAFLYQRGVVRQGRLHEFVRGIRAVHDHRRKHACCVPEELPLSKTPPRLRDDLDVPTFIRKKAD